MSRSALDGWLFRFVSYIFLRQTLPVRKDVPIPLHHAETAFVASTPVSKASRRPSRMDDRLEMDQLGHIRRQQMTDQPPPATPDALHQPAPHYKEHPSLTNSCSYLEWPRPNTCAKVYPTSPVS